MVHNIDTALGSSNIAKISSTLFRYCSMGRLILDTGNIGHRTGIARAGTNKETIEPAKELLKNDSAVSIHVASGRL